MIKKVLIIILILILILLGIRFGYYPKCLDQECFTRALVNCEKSIFLSQQENLAMNYKVLGKSTDKCRIEVKINNIKSGNFDLGKLENKKMICDIPPGILTLPESNLNNCHGQLKEDMQQLIIERMHTEIIENLGSINESLTKIL